MALLNVYAIAEDGIAAPRNNNESAIIVSITNSKGNGVRGLGISNFTLESVMVGPGGSNSQINSVMPTETTGVYIIRISPISNRNWSSGVYVWALKVTFGDDNGQTLCSTNMD